jgi:hypothetical protein
MGSRFEDIPQRIFLDSSLLQTLQTYGEFLYENQELSPEDRIHRDSQDVAKVTALRWIMQVAERAPFQFALSDNSFAEVERRGDHHYLQWAYDVLDHWRTCLDESGEPRADPVALANIESASMNYLGVGDRALLKDAVLLECDTFLTMENNEERGPHPPDAQDSRPLTDRNVGHLAPLGTPVLLNPHTGEILHGA